MADRGGIQLLPETRKKLEIKIPGENRLIGIGVGVIFIVLAIYGGFTYYVNDLTSQADALSADAAQLNQERIKNKDTNQNLIALTKQANIISQLLDNHLFWTQALINIENTLEPEVYLKNFSASAAKGTVSLVAAAPSYLLIARQLAAFSANDAITDVMLGGAKSNNAGNVEFTLELKFNQVKFLKKQQ